MCSKSLLDMPDLVVRKILEDCDFRSILVVRKVCRVLRDFIDHSSAKSSLTYVRIETYIGSISLDMRFSNFGGDCYNSATIHYEHKYENNCKMVAFVNNNSGRTTRKEILFENTNFVQVFCNDLEGILRANNSILEKFLVEFRGTGGCTVVVKEECSKIYEMFEKVFCLENRRKTIRMFEYNYKEPIMKVMERSFMFRKLKVSSFVMYYVPKDFQFMNILNNIDPKYLKRLEVNGRTGNEVQLDTEIIEERIKWEKMEFLCLYTFFTLIPVQKLAKVPNLRIKPKRISEDDILFFKDVS